MHCPWIGHGLVRVKKVSRLEVGNACLDGWLGRGEGGVIIHLLSCLVSAGKNNISRIVELE